ncbi:MAG TPA: hypothetical protein VGO47_02620 [Chlamydiales bacterium]|nr:hypothetical protein [Chlamydiales bacterium]
MDDIDNIPGDNIFQKGASVNQNDVQNNGNLVDLSEPENMNSRYHTPSPQVIKTENVRFLDVLCCSYNKSYLQDQTRPFSSLRALLDIAQREAETLRRRCKDLETLILQSGGRLESYVGQLDGIQETNRLESTAQEITSKGKYTLDAPSKAQRASHDKDKSKFDIDSLSQLETRELLKV